MAEIPFAGPSQNIPSSEIHLILQRVAGIILDRVELTFEPLPEDRLDLRPALASGHLSQSAADQRVTFPDHSLLQEYIARHAANLADQAWLDPEVLATTFADIQNKAVRLQMRHELVVRTIQLLASEHGRDVIDLVRQAATQHVQAAKRNGLFFLLYGPFCAALPGLQADPLELESALGPILCAISNDGRSGLINEAIGALAGKDRATAEALFNAFSESSQPAVNTMAATALAAMSRFSLIDSHCRALGLTSDPNLQLCLAGIAALSMLHYSAGEHALLQQTLDRLSSLRALVDTQISQALLEAYGRLVDTTPEAGVALSALVSEKPDLPTAGIALLLLRKCDLHSSRDWFRCALNSLIRMKLPSKDIFLMIDHCLHSIVIVDPTFALSFIENITHFREVEGDSDFCTTSAFPSTCRYLREQRVSLLASTITRWLATTRSHLHGAARDLIEDGHDSRDASIPYIKLCKATLSELSEDSVLQLVAHAMGHLIFGKTLAFILISALDREPPTAGICDLVRYALSEFVLYNYPGTGKFIKDLVPNAETSALASEVITSALTASEAYYRALALLPRLNELAPPARRLALVRQAREKLTTEALEKAREGSPLLQIVNRVPIKYGRTVFTELGEEFTEPSRMATLSHTVEIPRGEIIDPVGMANRRHRWRMAGTSKTDTGDGTK